LEAPAIATRLWVWAVVLRALKRLLPLEQLVRLMHQRGGATTGGDAFQRKLERYLAQSGRFPFRPPSNCLERSLGVYRLLCGINAAPTLVVGFRSSDARTLEGHVWVTVGDRPIGETADAVSGYTAIMTFDADACRSSSPESDRSPAEIRFH
jgi:hypothetical protein